MNSCDSSKLTAYICSNLFEAFTLKRAFYTTVHVYHANWPFVIYCAYANTPCENRVRGSIVP